MNEFIIGKKFKYFGDADFTVNNIQDKYISITVNYEVRENTKISKFEFIGILKQYDTVQYNHLKITYPEEFI